MKLLFLLTVVGVRTMLAHVMLLDEKRIHRQGRVHRVGDESHFGTLLHDLGVVDGIVGRGAPGERSVVLHQHGRRVVGVDLTDIQNLIDDHVTRLQFIVALHLSFRHVPGTGDVLIEVVGMSGADVWNVTA